MSTESTIPECEGICGPADVDEPAVRLDNAQPVTDTLPPPFTTFVEVAVGQPPVPTATLPETGIGADIAIVATAFVVAGAILLLVKKVRNPFRKVED